MEIRQGLQGLRSVPSGTVLSVGNYDGIHLGHRRLLERCRAVRDRIGAEIHRRIRSAMGPDADARTVSALEMTYFGALVHAGSGYVSYREIADRLTYVVGLILGEDRDTR